MVPVSKLYSDKSGIYHYMLSKETHRVRQVYILTWHGIKNPEGEDL